ncbi:MAG: RNA 3'-terminal phosphate cyclase [Syntrophobacteraceae bacterium]
MIEIDGAQKSGSGTLVRFAIALCTLLALPARIFRIREKREKPGLRPQHLQAVKACAMLCSGRLEGAEVGSREIVYYPGKNLLRGGAYEWDIGTAGSATMMTLALVPIALFSGGKSRFIIRGGLFQDFAPTAFHLQKVLFPTLARMGASVRLEIKRPGYVPRGGGELVVHVEPLNGPLRPFERIEQGRIGRIEGISLASHLDGEKVARRMADSCEALLAQAGYRSEIQTIEDNTAVQKGAALLLWAETSTGCLIGSDRAGKRGRRSEAIAEHAVDALFEDLSTGATVDRFAADQLILFAGLALGRSTYKVPSQSDHIESNLWLIEKILGARIEGDGKLLTIHGAGFTRK